MIKKLINGKNYFLDYSEYFYIALCSLSTVFLVGFAISQVMNDNKLSAITCVLKKKNQISELAIIDLSNKKFRFDSLTNSLDYKKALIKKVSGVTISNNLPEKYLDLMFATADYYKIPYRIYFRLGAKESSNFSSTKSSPKGAMYYFQIMPGTFKSYAKLLPSVKEHNIETNIMISGLILSDLYNTYNDWTMTVAAYNAGTNAVDRYKGVPNFKETKNYVAYVMR